MKWLNWDLPESFLGLRPSSKLKEKHIKRAARLNICQHGRNPSRVNDNGTKQSTFWINIDLHSASLIWQTTAMTSLKWDTCGQIYAVFAKCLIIHWPKHMIIPCDRSLRHIPLCFFFPPFQTPGNIARHNWTELPRDGEVTFEKLLFQLLLGRELRNYSYFSYSFHCKDVAWEAT